jgi:hypothetical protein
MPYDQIVIGNGSSALNFLQSAIQGVNATFKSEKTLVIGKSDLWSRTKGDHPMGQPPELLQRQLGSDRTTTVLEKPRPMGLDKGDYVTSGAYTNHLSDVRKKLIEALPEKIWFLNESVAAGGIQRSGNGFKVTVASDTYESPQVIVASGIGTPSTLPALDLGIKALSSVKSQPRGYEEIVDAVTYYNSNPPAGLTVLIYGGSATSSWACNHAWKSGARKLMWMCRRGIDQISTEGNPVGRNSEVIQMAVNNKLIEGGEILGVAVNLGAQADEPRLMVDLKIFAFDPNAMNRAVDDKTGKVTLTKKRLERQDRRITIEIHQLVYAVGSNPLGEGGPGNILSKALLNELVPVYAKDYQFMTRDDDILLAYSTPKQDLWVVGAAVFGGLGMPNLKKLQSKYASVGEFLPTAGTPPEGIAILSTTIDALTGRMEEDPAKFDWNRARHDEIANLFKKLFALPESQARMLAKDLVDKRSDSKFVLPPKSIEKAIEDFNKVYGTTMDYKLLKLG